MLDRNGDMCSCVQNPRSCMSCGEAEVVAVSVEVMLRYDLTAVCRPCHVVDCLRPSVPVRLRDLVHVMHIALMLKYVGEACELPGHESGVVETRKKQAAVEDG